jgi:hypothetical protein
MWRVLPFVAALIVSPASWAADTEARRTCPAMDQEFAVGLELRSAPVSYRNDLSTAEIDRLGGGLHRRQPGFKTTGLTVADLTYGMRMEYWQVAYRENITCLYPHKVEIDLGYRSTTVYVARQYGPETCPYDVVLDHERQHVAINRQVLDDYAPRIRNAVQKTVMKLFPIAARSGKRAQNEARRKLEVALQKAVQTMIAERDRRHAVLDTPDNYRQTQSLCEIW